MNKKQLVEILRNKKIYNDHEFSKDSPFIYYSSSEPRSVIPAHWSLTKKGIKLSDAWYDHGSYTLSVGNREDKKLKFEEIKQYANKKFNITDEWVKGPFGGFYPKDFYEKRIKEILE